MNVIFDTNSVYYLDSMLSYDEFELFKEKSKTGLHVFISPITAIEMASRLKEKPLDFSRVQQALKKLFDLNPSFLPDPELQLTEYVLDTKLDPKDYGPWREILYTIKVAPDVTALESGFDDLTTLTRRSVNISQIHSFRKKYETYYISDIETPLKLIIPGFSARIAKGKHTRLQKGRIADFEKYLLSPNWTAQIKIMLINRTLLPLPIEQVKIDKIFERIRYFKKAYENLFLKIFQEGYIPNMKKKNDYNDWHFNVYFHNANDFIFVTSESNVLFKELLENKRCIKIRDIIHNSD